MLAIVIAGCLSSIINNCFDEIASLTTGLILNELAGIILT